MSTARPPRPVPAATILLVRDGSVGLEVFMVERHREIDFAHGALVFPGGKLDPGDADPALCGRCAGAAAFAPEALALRVAGIRETFEECGVLLARPRGGSALLDGTRLPELVGRYRGALLADEIGLGRIVEQEDLELACDLLVPFAHWITPEFMPRRFDTHFFLVAAPADQAARHDGRESVDSVWITPDAAIADAESSRRTIIFPTLLNLKKLARSTSVTEAEARARREPLVTVLPQLARGASGLVVRIPAEAGYGISEAPAPRLAGKPGAA